MTAADREEDRQDDEEPDDRAVERLRVADRDERPREPDDAARTIAPRMLSPIQSQAITVIESAFLPAPIPPP